MHQERKTKQKSSDNVPDGAVPAYLLDREGQTRAKVLSNLIKQKRKEKAVSWLWVFFICTFCATHKVISLLIRYDARFFMLEDYNTIFFNFL